ncbi:MAG: hypothetical protein COA42_01385 [Alteromonadaceae bacterium]|nr:MAG: hypothetical protein COA42_01385 [Alteromonadaceae bacterium]
MTSWYLEGDFHNDGTVSHQHIKNLPAVLGRDESLGLTIYSPSVSRKHARLELRNDALWIMDLDSRNGTYVNRELIKAPTHLDHGDIIHLGSAEIRLIDQHHSLASNGLEESSSDETKFISVNQLSEHFPSGIRELEELISIQNVNMAFQPIIDARAGMKVCGYEVLGRGASKDLPTTPIELFRIAESFNLAIELSELMRDKGVAVAEANGLTGSLLLNTHPLEMNDPERVLFTMQQLRKRHPNAELTLEIHEQCITGETDYLRMFKERLDKLSVKLAFDDFGVGQSRLMEMVEAKPDLIKFDRVLIDSLDSADESRVNLLRHLKNLVAELSIHTLAECVSTRGEYEVCAKMGFEFYQGYYFAKPQPAKNFSTQAC